MNGYIAPTERQLISDLQSTARGPKRNGVFALWLFVRMCDGMLGPGCLSEKSRKKRLEGLKRRMSSLSLPPPLRRALSGGLRELEAGTDESAAIVLRQMVAPVRDVLGGEAADAMLSAARVAKQKVAEVASGSQ